jgi:hypothetical protein
MGAVPVPASDTLWGLPDALSVTVTEPDRAPAAAGVKVTLIEQFAPAASVVPHAFVSAKSPLLVMLEIAMASLPVFESVIVCAALVVPTGCAPKFKLVGLRLATGAPPVPASATVCGLPEAVSFRVTLPVMFPVTVGEKLTLMEQLAPVANEEPQLSVSAKFALTDIANKSFWFPVFVKVTVCDALVVPSGWGPKVRLFGTKVMVVGETSYAPRSTTAMPSPLPSTTRGLPSKSVVGRLGAELFPASTAGEPHWMWKSAALKNSGSADMFPGWLVVSHMPAQRFFMRRNSRATAAASRCCASTA